MSAEEGERWGFFNRLCPRARLLAEALELAAKLAAGPTFAHMMTKTMLNQEWEHEHRGGDRGRGPGPGALHADRGLPTRVPGVRREAPPEFAGN